jgi:cell division septum initiation protein DivIVA
LDQVARDIVRVGTLRRQQEEEIEKLRQQMENLMQLAAMGGESARSIHEKLEVLQKEIDQKELENHINYHFTDNLHIKWNIPIKYSRFTDEEKKAVCQHLIKKIDLHPNGDLEVTWKV